jgi:radical SAM protein with 4Fe4S-binding SPASM domain
MGVHDWIEVLSDAYAAGCRSVQFIGGEPMIVPYLSDLLTHAHELGFHEIEVFTNATRTTNGVLSALRSTGAKLACSFYSADGSVHDRIVARAGSFERTLEGIDRILATGLDLRVGIVEMDANRGHGTAARRLLESRGVSSDRISHDHLRPVGRGRDAVEQDRTQGLCGQCWKGRLCVTPKGEAYPCIMSRDFPVGNVLEEGLTQLLRGAALNKARNEIAEAQSLADSSCTPMDCTPNRFCGPDGLCGPGRVDVVDAPNRNASCTPMDCVPNRFCGPDGLCGPGRINAGGMRSVGVEAKQ